MDRIEAAARRYCELMGVDPDEMVTVKHDSVRKKYIIVNQPRWQTAAPAICEVLAIQQALKETGDAG